MPSFHQYYPHFSLCSILFCSTVSQSGFFSLSLSLSLHLSLSPSLSPLLFSHRFLLSLPFYLSLSPSFPSPLSLFF
ncbi:hypothetical protein FKM82_021605 [Ascaphus truei]